MSVVAPFPRGSDGPTAVNDRLPLLDAIRGLALGGILLANLMSFFGADMVGAERRLAMPAGHAGETVLFGINWLVEGKFYSVFSMLLGVGFSLQAARAARRGSSADDFGRFFRRRMMVLIGIGLLHMYGLWAGDILTLYGVMGILLPTLIRLSGTARTALVLVLFSVPFATHAMVLATDGRADPRAPFAAAGAALRERFGIADRSTLDVFARGSAVDYWAWNTAYAVVRPGTYLQSGRGAKVLALFIVGAWIGAAVLPRLGGLRQSLVHTALAGTAIGLPASYVYAAIKADAGSTFLLSSEGLLQTAAYTLGTTPLALAYLAMAALAWQTRVGRAVLTWFVPLGRLALSVYLTQTIIQVILFTGVGLGLAGRISLVWLPVVAVVMLTAQRSAALRWLRTHGQGPLEWVWRRLSYRTAAAPQG